MAIRVYGGAGPYFWVGNGLYPTIGLNLGLENKTEKTRFNVEGQAQLNTDILAWIVGPKVGFGFYTPKEHFIGAYLEGGLVDAIDNTSSYNITPFWGSGLNFELGAVTLSLGLRQFFPRGEKTFLNLGGGIGFSYTFPTIEDKVA